MKQNLIEKITAEMESDDADREKQSRILILKYKSATPEEKEKMDDVTMCLCGWSLDTLIKKK